MSARIVPIAEPRQRQPRRKANAHLEWIRTLPCIITGQRGNIDAAHIRYGDLRYGKRSTGLGEKSDDRWTVPLHHDLHVGWSHSQHSAGEREWWSRQGVNPVIVALCLWGVSGDDEMAEAILRATR